MQLLALRTARHGPISSACFSIVTNDFSCRTDTNNVKIIFSNLNVGWRAPQKGRVELAEEVVDVGARAGDWIRTKENSRERDLGNRKLRRRHVDEVASTCEECLSRDALKAIWIGRPSGRGRGCGCARLRQVRNSSCLVASKLKVHCSNGACYRVQSNITDGS